MKNIFTFLALTIGFSMNAQDFWFQGTAPYAIQTTYATASGIILQQWEIHNSKWRLFYSNGIWHNSKWKLFYSNGI